MYQPGMETTPHVIMFGISNEASIACFGGAQYDIVIPGLLEGPREKDHLSLVSVE